MAKTRAELLKEIADSTPTGGGNNLRDGKYRLAIRKTGFGDGFNGARWDTDVVVYGAMKVPVIGLGGADKDKVLDIEPNPIGSDVGIVKMLTTDKPYAAPGLGDVKAFILALYGESALAPAELIEILDALDKNNAAYGMVIDCTTRRRLSKEKQVEMVLQDWHNVPQTDADILATRKWIESLVLQPTQPVSVVASPLGPPRV